MPISSPMKIIGVPGEGEHQAPGHAQTGAVATEHRGGTAAQPVAVKLHRLVRPEGRKISSRWGPGACPG